MFAEGLTEEGARALRRSYGNVFEQQGAQQVILRRAFSSQHRDTAGGLHECFAQVWLLMLQNNLTTNPNPCVLTSSNKQEIMAEVLQ